MTFKSNRQKECVQMPGKMARSDPRPSVRVTRGVGSGQHFASVLQEGRENANIDAGLGFIWRISVNGRRSHIGFSKPPKTLRFCIVDVSQIVPNPRLVWHGFGTDLARRANLSNPYPRLAAAADLAFLTSLRRCAMLPPSGSWRAGHVDYLACLPDRVHGRHNGRQQCSGPLVVAGRRSGPLEILRDGDRTDVWRP